MGDSLRIAVIMPELIFFQAAKGVLTLFCKSYFASKFSEFHVADLHNRLLLHAIRTLSLQHLDNYPYRSEYTSSTLSFGSLH